MADQKRWFKVWTSLLVDMDHLPNEVIGQWLRLGCRTALVGNHGSVRFESLEHLARFLDVTVHDLDTVRNTLPSVMFEEGKTVYDGITVTFKNWVKYQEDSTQAERQKRSRSKRRGEEKRREKSSTPPPTSPRSADAPTGRPEDLTIPRPGSEAAGNGQDPESMAALLQRNAELRRLKGYAP